ncbi:hypothetical protein K8R04_02805 [Candidatus Uhrbacteria bacterium]|nr:hypothetical protein [Candidatus Uhrbacteria bacterium]
MAKAQITSKSGAIITIEGTSKEVAELVAALDRSIPAGPVTKNPGKTKQGSRTTSSGPTLGSLIGELTDGGFFKKPKELGAIKLALEEHGYHYPVTTLSPTLLRLVKRRQLRRIREGNRWTYVGQ